MKIILFILILIVFGCVSEEEIQMQKKIIEAETATAVAEEREKNFSKFFIEKTPVPTLSNSEKSIRKGYREMNDKRIEEAKKRANEKNSKIQRPTPTPKPKIIETPAPTKIVKIEPSEHKVKEDQNVTSKSNDNGRSCNFLGLACKYSKSEVESFYKFEKDYEQWKKEYSDAISRSAASQANQLDDYCDTRIGKGEKFKSYSDCYEYYNSPIEYGGLGGGSSNIILPSSPKKPLGYEDWEPAKYSLDADTLRKIQSYQESIEEHKVNCAAGRKLWCANLPNLEDMLDRVEKHGYYGDWGPGQ